MFSDCFHLQLRIYFDIKIIIYKSEVINTNYNFSLTLFRYF